MSKAFESKIKEEFEQLNKDNFKIILSDHRLFVCGGPVNSKSLVPPSFRERVLRHTGAVTALHAIHDALVRAEDFKDYFKENNYPDLLKFEDDIAAISSLIIIFLESPGSLVELGMFSGKPNYYQKLLIVAPSEETEAEDSFIYLGPLEHIRRKDETSVVTYPWPKAEMAAYDIAHLEDLAEAIQTKLANIDTENTFAIQNTGHLALLICEIINLTSPVQKFEIEIALDSMGIPLSPSDVSRYLYILQKLDYIGRHIYSSNKYYYPTHSDRTKATFGKTKNGKHSDREKIKMSIKQSFITDTKDTLSRRRVNAQKQIAQILAAKK